MNAQVAVEFLVEPFVEGRPGEHVTAAVDAFAQRGVDVDIGPFASVATGDIDTIADAVRVLVINAMGSGATNINLQVARAQDSLKRSTLHGALDTMLEAAQREVGSTSAEWTRADKQRIVRLLDEQGAFLLRGAVDDVAGAMGVSRITIYNYLNAIGTAKDGE